MLINALLFGYQIIYWCSNSSYISLYLRKRVGGLKLEELPGLEALQIPGVNMIMPIAVVLSINGFNHLVIFDKMSHQFTDGPITKKCLEFD